MKNKQIPQQLEENHQIEPRTEYYTKAPYNQVATQSQKALEMFMKDKAWLDQSIEIRITTRPDAVACLSLGDVALADLMPINRRTVATASCTRRDILKAVGIHIEEG